MSWTTELAAAETAEQTYRANRKGSQNNYLRFDARGGVLLTDWIAARSAVSTAAPRTSLAFWANVAARAVINMGASWSVVQNQLGSGPVQPFLLTPSSGAPVGFPGGTLDGLFGGLVSQWTTDVWVANGRTVPSAGFPPMEAWTYLFANSLTIAGAT